MTRKSARWYGLALLVIGAGYLAFVFLVDLSRLDKILYPIAGVMGLVAGALTLSLVSKLPKDE